MFFIPDYFKIKYIGIDKLRLIKSSHHYVLIMFTLVTFISCQLSNNNNKISPPNVIFIMMDDLGYGQFGVFSDSITTADFPPFFVKLVDSLQGYSLDKSLEFSRRAMPTLKSLSENGLLFKKAYTSSSLCAPSRVGIATGRHQNKLGFYTNTDVESKGIYKGSHLVEKLKNLSYKTAHIGKWHLGRRDKTIIDTILKKHRLSNNIRWSKYRNTNPQAYNEIKNSGYIGSVIKQHNPLNNGFDYYYGYNHWASQYYNDNNVWEDFKHVGVQKEYNTDAFTDKALDFMEAQIGKKDPFYVQIHYHAVHDSIEPVAPKKYLDKFKSYSHHLNNFYAHINGVDQNVKRIVSFLKRNNLYENTIIVFTSDNGAMSGGVYNGHKTGSPLPGNAPFAGHKGNYYQGGIRVPLLFHWPSGIKIQGVSESLVSTMDILPSIIDLVGGTVPENLDGRSLRPIFEQSLKETVRHNLIWAGMQSNRWGFLITKSTKQHDNEGEHAPPTWTIIEGNYLLRFTGVLEPGIYFDNMQGRKAVFELYNIKNDPGETMNILDKMPIKAMELAHAYFDKSKGFTPPQVWNKEKWLELANSKNNLLKSEWASP